MSQQHRNNKPLKIVFDTPQKSNNFGYKTKTKLHLIHPKSECTFDNTKTKLLLIQHKNETSFYWLEKYYWYTIKTKLHLIQHKNKIYRYIFKWNYFWYNTKTKLLLIQDKNETTFDTTQKRRYSWYTSKTKLLYQVTFDTRQKRNNFWYIPKTKLHLIHTQNETTFDIFQKEISFDGLLKRN